MSREEQRNAIMDAFVLQGECEALQEEIGKLKTSISAKENEINRLKSLGNSLEEEEKVLAEKESKKEKVSDELDSLLGKLSSMNIKLPLGSATKSTRL